MYYLIGEYTDDDVYSTNNSSLSSDTDCYMEPNTSDRNIGPIVTGEDNRRTLRTKQLFDYLCPVCNKELHSAGGFRGHVLKQHPNFNPSGFKGNNWD